jgi:hypothetical protein
MITKYRNKISGPLLDGIVVTNAIVSLGQSAIACHDEINALHPGNAIAELSFADNLTRRDLAH